MLKSAIIAHTHQDADDLYRKGLFRKGLVFSTHTSVNTYLRDRYNVDSKCLSEMFTIDDIRKWKELVASIVDSLLQKLDEHVSYFINEKLGTDLRYFSALYSYIGKIHLCSHVFFREGLKRLIGQLEARKILVYNHRFDSHLDSVIDLSRPLSYEDSNCSVTLIESRTGEGRNEDLLRCWYRLWKRVINRTSYSMPSNLRTLREKYFNWYQTDLEGRLKTFDEHKKTVLLYDLLNSLKLSREHLKVFNVVEFSDLCRWSIAGGQFDCAAESLLAGIDEAFKGIKVESTYEQIMLSDVSSDFVKSIPTYLRILGVIVSIEERFPISLGIWGISPNERIPALVFEYLKAKEKTVLGVQHGCVFGDSYEPWHIDSDFNRCKYYASYGFDENDLKRLYPKREIGCRVLPFGFGGSVYPGKRSKRIDVLFPVTNNLSMFNAGMARIPPHVLVERQTAILNYLDSLHNLKVVIKPFPSPTWKTSSLLPILRQLRNVTVIDHMALNKFLEEYMPRTIIIEYPSQPVFETIHLDAEIFLLNDPVIPFDDNALDMLRKRVHYFEDVDSLIHSHGLFMRNLLTSKRDESFMLHYLRKPADNEKIDQLASSLLNNTKPLPNGGVH